MSFTQRRHFNMGRHLWFGAEEAEERGKIDHARANRAVEKPIAGRGRRHPIILQVDMHQIGQNPFGKDHRVFAHGQGVAGVERNADIWIAHFFANPNQVSGGGILMVLNTDLQAQIFGHWCNDFQVLHHLGQVALPAIVAPHRSAVATEDATEDATHDFRP